MSRAWGLRAELKARGEGDAVTSLTKSNAEISWAAAQSQIGPQSHAPKGFRRRSMSIMNNAY
jgi:hypothetical protein